MFTIGSPLSLDKIITTGIVSKVEPHTIMSDFNINPGNSGGPLIDTEGRLVGINTFILSGSGGSMGIGFAVPVNMARYVMERMRG